MPGTYTSQSWPIDPNHTAIFGSGKGADNPTDGLVTAAHFDAGGGEAFKIPSTGGGTSGTELRNFSVSGTIKFNASKNRDFTLANLLVTSADSASASGRGIEILTDSFLYEARNITIVDTDAAGWYSEHDGQSLIENVNVLNCNRNGDDNAGFYASSVGGGGGEATCDSCYVLGAESAAGTDNFRFDGIFRPDIQNCKSETAPNDGFRILAASGDSKVVRLRDGAAFNSGRDGVRAEGYDCVGVYVDRMQFEGNTGDAVHFNSSGVKYSELGTIYDDGSNKTMNGNVSISPSGGFENYLEPFWHTRNGGPQDVTNLTVPKFAIELDDGTNTSSGNVGLAVHWGGWTYMN
jgi:hypothetical protein